MSFDIKTIPAHPLAAKLRKHEKHEKAMLRRSMERGFDPAFPIVVYRDEKLGWTILDGVNRRDMALELDLSQIPWKEFHGTHKEAAAWVAEKQLGRRNEDKSQRAFLMAAFRDALDLNLDEAAEAAGVSVSQMEKASAVAHKSKKYTEKGIRGELTVNQAAKKLRRTAVEHHSDDPKVEIERTRDRMKAGIEKLKDWAREYFDPLLDRRGAEMLKASLGANRKIVQGRLHMGLSLVDAIIQQITRNMPKGWCPTCNGGGCQDCGGRLYITPHEEALAKNAQRNGKS